MEHQNTGGNIPTFARVDRIERRLDVQNIPR
jgi:hypothetical protein